MSAVRLHHTAQPSGAPPDLDDVGIHDPRQSKSAARRGRREEDTEREEHTERLATETQRRRDGSNSGFPNR
jgi:hypothetical protein